MAPSSFVVGRQDSLAPARLIPATAAGPSSAIAATTISAARVPATAITAFPRVATAGLGFALAGLRFRRSEVSAFPLPRRDLTLGYLFFLDRCG
jgi:hypothetical protein